MAVGIPLNLLIDIIYCLIMQFNVVIQTDLMNLAYPVHVSPKRSCPVKFSAEATTFALSMLPD